MEVSAASNRRALRRALVFMILTNFLWGSYFPIVKVLGNLLQVPLLDGKSNPLLAITFALSFLSFRFLLGFCVLLAFYPRLIRNITKTSMKAGLNVAIFFGTGMLSQVVGLCLISATRSALVTSMTVLVVPFFAWGFYKKPISLRMLLACVLSFLGAAILVGAVTITNGSLEFDRFAVGKGELITFLGTICFTVSICQIDLYNKRGIREELNAGMFIGTIIATTLAALVLGWFIPPEEAIAPAPFQGLSSYGLMLSSKSAFAIFTVIVICCTTFPFYWMNTYQGYFSPGHAALIYTLEPVSAAFWSLWLPGVLSGLLQINYPSEQLSLSLLLGGSIILISNLIPSLEE